MFAEDTDSQARYSSRLFPMKTPQLLSASCCMDCVATCDCIAFSDLRSYHSSRSASLPRKLEVVVAKNLFALLSSGH